MTSAVLGSGRTYPERSHVVCARKSAAPERKFSKAGDVNRKKRASLKCENIEELVFLNEALPVVKKMRAEKEIKGASMEGSAKK